MSKRILITGGAGFIGSHLADELLEHGYKVRAYDCLSEHVHGPVRERPSYLNRDVELVVGDLSDRWKLRSALKGVDVVYHLAAKVGVGQSMYEIEGYTATNNLGSAILLEELLKNPVERLVVASSMSIYGEGMYENAAGDRVPGKDRSIAQLQRKEWELQDREGNPLRPVPTPETKAPALASVYALSKYDQERMCLIFGRAYRIPTVALRFFNVYGPRQSLSNPYTGVLAIFASALLKDRPVTIYEDGNQQRDFVHVTDIARACRLAMESPNAADNVFNIGSGRAFTVRQVADQIAAVLGKEDLEPVINQKYRVGDIRHCFADISLASALLGYKPQVKFDEGIAALAEWLSRETITHSAPDAHHELLSRGLTVG
jgi:dTDP-L-rhamnose 4-epimerase